MTQRKADRIMWATLAVAIVLTLLVGCATPQYATKAAPLPIVTVEKCVKREDLPVIPPTAATRDGTMKQDAAAVSADARRYRQIAIEQAAILDGCAQ